MTEYKDYCLGRVERIARALGAYPEEEPDDETRQQVENAVEALEAVDWKEVESVSTTTAAVFATILRRELEEGEP